MMPPMRPSGGDSRKPYADYCHCQSCSDARHRASAPPEHPPGPPPSTSGGDDAGRHHFPAGDHYCDEDENDSDDQGQDLQEETEEEGGTQEKEEPRIIPSSYSLLASDPAASRRPIVCPVQLCGRHIAVHTLVSHFRFEHPEVPKVVLSPDNPSATLPVAPLHYLSPLTTECAAILRVSWKDEEDKIQPDFWKLVLAYAVMPDGGFVVWVFGMLDGDQEIMAKLEMSTWISEESSDGGDCGDLAPYDSFCKEGSEDLSPYLVRAASYLGPVVPLREAQEAENILARGDCLYLTPGLITLFTSAPQQASIQVTIIF